MSIEGSIADAEAFARREAAAREKKEKVSERGDGGVSGGVVSGSKLEDGDDEDGERTRARAHPRARRGWRRSYATHPLVVLVAGFGSATLHAFASRRATRRLVRDARVPSTRISSSISSRRRRGGVAERRERAQMARVPMDVDGRRERPFRWCQHLAGVDFLPAARAGLAEAVHEGVATHQRQARVRHVLAAIRARITRGRSSSANPGFSRMHPSNRTRRTRMHPLPNPNANEPETRQIEPHRTPHPTTPLTGASPAALARRDVTRSPPRVVSRCDLQVRATSWRETTNVREGDDETRPTRATGPGTGTGPGSDTATRTVSVTARRFRADVSRVESSRLAAGTASTSSPTSSSPPSSEKPPTFAPRSNGARPSSAAPVRRGR